MRMCTSGCQERKQPRPEFDGRKSDLVAGVCTSVCQKQKQLRPEVEGQKSDPVASVYTFEWGWGSTRPVIGRPGADK